jgi:hypothetical protein
MIEQHKIKLKVLKNVVLTLERCLMESNNNVSSVRIHDEDNIQETETSYGTVLVYKFFTETLHSILT